MLRDAQAAHPPPIARGRRPRVLYATQGAAEPPTITLFANGEFPPTYLRYLERKIREGFKLGPSPHQAACAPAHQLTPRCSGVRTGCAADGRSVQNHGDAA